ncbi:MAG: outer membrane beta-barrel protein [Betaproteobacteria bacterium]
MKRATASGTLGLVVFAVIGGPLAVADESAWNWYIGGSVGQSRAKIDDVRITSGLLAGRLTTTSISDDDRDTGGKIFGGYRFNRNFALEGGYFDLGRFGFTANTLPLGTLTGNIKVRGLNLDLVGTLPITEKLSAFGRVGANYAESRDSFRGTGLVRVINPNPSTRDTNIKYGAGLQYAFNDSLAMRAEVERYRINDAIGNRGDIDLVSVGLVYHFGASKPARTAYATAPEPAVPATRVVVPDPVIAAPPAPPIPPPVAVPPPRQKVTFSADALFDFDKAIIKPAGKQALDKFATDLRGTSFEVISVTGHTDRIGSRAYNLTLSTHRAEAVKSYLVNPAGIAAGKIVARGADESEPVTKPGDCKGNKATRALIACLQPDRRVDVEVTGTK